MTMAFAGIDLAAGSRMARRLLLIWTLSCLVPSVAADASNDASLSAEQVRDDFATLYQTLQAAHFDLYAHRSKAEYGARYQQMLAAMQQPLSRAEVETRFQQFVAYGRVAHARIDGLQARFGQYRQQGGRALPIQIRIQDGAVYIAENYSGLASLQRGDQLLQLDGVPIKTVLHELAQHVSADNDYLLNTLFELWFPALVWQQYGPREQFVVQIQRQGQLANVTVPSRTRTEAQAADAKQPAVLSLDWDKRESRILAATDKNTASIGYLRPGPFYNNAADATDPWDNRAFIAFIDEAFTQFRQQSVPAVLIDLRDNPGGDNSFSDHMVSWFASKPYRFAADFRIRISEATTASNAKRLQPGAETGNDITHKFAALYAKHKNGDVVSYPFPLTQPRPLPRYEGKVYLLINRRSYSNTVMVAAIAQDYGFATVLGEETSDLASTYGAMEQFVLPHSGLVVGYPKAHILRPNGDPAARGVQPDWPIRTPIVESADDPVLQQAVTRIRSATHKH